MYSNEQIGNNPDYVLAVSQALAGRQEGYDFLYQSTYQKKFYIAKKYMGNDSDAQDVLQDAYVQAFSKLDTLKEPDKFPGCLLTSVSSHCISMVSPSSLTPSKSEKNTIFFFCKAFFAVLATIMPSQPGNSIHREGNTGNGADYDRCAAGRSEDVYFDVSSGGCQYPGNCPSYGVFRKYG